MKALLWNRPGAVADFGGDTLQWLRTSEELVALGVEVERSDAAQPDLAGYDLVHLFNLQSDEAALPVAEAARAAGLPIVSADWLSLSIVATGVTTGRFNSLATASKASASSEVYGPTITSGFQEAT